MELINWCKRYFSVIGLLIVAFLAYILFFQEKNLSKYYEFNTTIDSLENEIAVNRDTMQYYHEMNHRLSTDPQTMEQVVREQYNMNRNGEDVYVFE